MRSIIALTLALVSNLAFGATAAETFTKLKSLAGAWTAETADGTTDVSYEVAANGSVVVERFHGMMTTYTVDGEKLRATHYCSAGNQPRFVLDATSTENELTFTLDGVGNLTDPNAGHMADLAFKFTGEGSFEQSWTFREGGVDMPAFTIKLTRKK